MRAIVIVSFIILCFLISYSVSVKEVVSQDVRDCFRCHSIKTLSKQLETKETISLYVDKAKFEKSVHGALDCLSCHRDINLENHPRPKKIADKRVYSKEFSKNCLRCHPRGVLMKPKQHGELIKKGEVFCSECHGFHYIGSIKEWKKKATSSEYCLACHKFDISKTLPSKEKLSLKVNQAEIKKSVHGQFPCIACHSDFSKVKHPIYGYKNKAQYRAEMTKICIKCHTDDELRKNPAHYAVTKTASCIECHGSHGVKPAKVVKALPENQYCLSCHSRAISMKMKNLETLSVQVKESDILASVHKKFKCTDCHKEFSTVKHPIREFDSISEYRAKAKDICNQCHQDAVQRYDKSIHAMALKRGEAQAPDCIKCHDYHKTVKITTDKSLSLSQCARCHSKEDEAFKLSIHNTALIQGKDAPVCSSCHNSHDVMPTNIANLNNACAKCHKDIKTTHNKWLWNPPVRLTSFVNVHFNSASCASCHSQAKKAVYLTVFDRAKKEFLTEDNIAKILGIDTKEVKGKLDLNGDGKVQENEIWQFMKAVKDKIDAGLLGRINVSELNDAHKIEVKAKAIKDCATCHEPKAQFDGKIEINREGAKPIRFDLEREALNSAHTIPNIKDFYVLGLTKIKTLDTLFFIALLAGVALPVGHITLRILTSPIRRKKKEEK